MFLISGRREAGQKVLNGVNTKCQFLSGRSVGESRSRLAIRYQAQHHRHESSSVGPSSKALPLSNLKVLDLSRVLAGPFCTQILSDYGADVIKVEQPGIGDETRQWRTSGETAQMWKDDYPLMSLYFCAVNRNKRSLTVDLKQEEGRKIIRKLVELEGYDVVVHNFIPGKMESFGLGYDDLRGLNPRVVYAEVSGYGATGPSSKKAGYDAIALAESGLLHITGDADGPPIKPGVAIADMSTGLYAHGAILAAVNARHLSGEGCKIEGSLFESSLSLLINVGMSSLNLDLDQSPELRRRGKRFGAGHPNLVPYNRYRTRDDRWLFVAANNNRQFKLFCEKLELADLAKQFDTNDSRVENRSEIDAVLGSRFNRKSLSEWLDVLEGSGLPYGPVNDVVDALENRQAEARDMVFDITEFEAAKAGVLRMIGPAVKLKGSDTSIRSKPPLLGEHTDDILMDLGYSPIEIKHFKVEGIV